ncbi:uncharacterized protein LOC128883791 [Hylaeus volcanicus]|uniref:uncharacterized protein LOC128883791 n=1 Tax=Hylaeus volcanicus TaxID=313075 RepID=UPI0023B84922|nr:uncharacterized protein LOC128883791 [Hylaeus volcanicus]XP_053992473.1 uncharacterized protein LOC128883791 [Hylaeus volcanicus]
MSSEIQFCKECSNLLYSKEDTEHKQLIFLCRSCDYLQYADPYSMTQNCVDRINYNFRSREDVNSYIAQGLDHDPTLPRAPNWKCENCNNVGAVYFQLPERVADDAMTLVYVCTECTFYQVKGKELLKDTVTDVGETSGSTLDEKKIEQPEKIFFSNDESDFFNEEKNSTNALNSFTESTQMGEKTLESPDVSNHSCVDLNLDDDNLGLDELGLGISDDDNDEF